MSNAKKMFDSNKNGHGSWMQIFGKKYKGSFPGYYKKCTMIYASENYTLYCFCMFMYVLYYFNFCLQSFCIVLLCFTLFLYVYICLIFN